MPPADRILYVQILAQMLIVDGILADEERTYLERIMDSLGMPEAERTEALSDVSIDSPVEERVSALSANAKRALLSEIEHALRADGKEPSRSEAHLLERVKRLLR